MLRQCLAAFRQGVRRCGAADFSGRQIAAPVRAAAFSSASSSADADDPLTAERDYMEYDVVIVGAGPAGLSAAIRLKQLEAETGKEISVCVLEKGAEVGAHILSGNVFEPRALDELLPDWKEREAPLETPAREDHFLFLRNETSSVKAPFIPSTLHNHGNYIISLGKLVRWLGEQAEELGVEIYPGFPASEVLYSEADGGVMGVATRDMGIAKDGTPKDGLFARGMELRARQTLFAEGCRGSCSEEVMKAFDLRKDCDPQAYGLGIKEVWEVPEEQHKPGYIQHTFGWPLDSATYGGSFLYHMDPNLVLVGFVVGLDYKNPYLSPYGEFQRFKHHPEVAKHLEGGECIAYGARCINEGGLQSVPKLAFPGGALVGCSAGFLNVPKIKGSHTAMKSGMVAAESVFEHLTHDDAPQAPGEDGLAAASCGEAEGYEPAMKASWVWDELKAVRNYAPAFKHGLWAGVAYSGLSATVLKGREPWTFSKTDGKRDCDKTEKAVNHSEIVYPAPDGKLSFDILTNLALSATDHEADQPAHLRVKPELKHVPNQVSIKDFAGPEQRFCPAKVYEYHENEETGAQELVINAQNCVHCKCCSIKMPEEYINWTVPEGPGGPAYEVM